MLAPSTFSLAVIIELWDAWELHFLIILSLFLQVFLFLFAGRRRCSVSWVLRTVLWLAYLSADSVAVFVLGHLAVNASEPRHQLMSFWAPFLLVHLGGQDTITALSKQDNELWLRHLLSLVTQVAVAGYVVTKASWSDRRLSAAMALMFISGCFKYAERTYCLYRARPDMLRSKSLHGLSRTVNDLQRVRGLAKESYANRALQIGIVGSKVRRNFSNMLQGSRGLKVWGGQWYITDIMSVDAPLNESWSVMADGLLPDSLSELLSERDRYRFYEYVGASLVRCYQRLYTKNPFRESINRSLSELTCICFGGCIPPVVGPCMYALFQLVPSLLALVLFAAAAKGDKLHTSRADTTVSYVLLVGALLLEVTASIFSILSFLSFNPPDGKIGSAVLHVASYIQPAWRRKQWSEELAQYSMIKRHTVGDTSAGKRFIRKWIGKLFGSWGIELFDTTHTLISGNHAPIKEFILDSLLSAGTRKEWNISSTRGYLALQKIMSGSQDSAYTTVYRCTSSGVDFPTSVLIWHIATDICYYCGDSANSASSNETKKHVLVSRQISHYIMYLVFKCGVMLTTNNQLVHDNVHDEIKKVLQDKPVNLGEKDAVMNLFRPKKKEDEEQEQEESTYEETAYRDNEEHQQQPSDEIKNTNSAANNNHVQEFLQSTLEALDSPVLPRARAMAQELIGIEDETERWGLIAAVWSEIIFYAAPRCGGAFHYEHLSTGGEFATHILLLMQSLGPFLPTPGA